MLLILPPAARSTEPPLSLARLAAFLRASAVYRGGEGRREAVRCLDLNREGADYLLGLDIDTEGRDTWTRSAVKRRALSQAILREPRSYAKPDRYRRAVMDLGRALRAASAGSGAEAGLADYRDERLSPTRYADLVASARDFEANLYYPFFSARIEAELSEMANSGSPAAAVGISIGYLSQALPAFAMIGYIRATRPGLRLIAGGGLVNSWLGTGLIGPDESFGGFVDALVAGRGERGILAAIGNDRFADIPAGQGDRGEMAASPSASRLGECLPPDFGDFLSLDYDAPTLILPYNFSWGCPWRRCSFCPEKAEGARYAALPAPRAMSEIESLVASSRPGLLHFTDNEIAPLYLRALADRPPGPRWYGFARFSEQLRDAAFCGRLAASGCAMLQLGLESADQSVLDDLGKGTRRETIDDILENLHAAGIAVYLYVLFGTPSETRDAALRTRDYLAEKASRIGFLNLALFNLPASSPEAAALRTRDFYEGDLSLYRDFVHPSGWNREEVRAFVSREIEGEPTIRTILARNPPIFTSNHAPFFSPIRGDADSDPSPLARPDRPA